MDRIDCQLLLGHGDEFVPERQVLVKVQPLRERPRAQLMLALDRSGRQAESLELSAATWRMLHDELGLEPSPRLREPEREILRHDPRLESPADAARGRSVARRSRKCLGLEAHNSLLAELAAELGDFGQTDSYADPALRRVSHDAT